MFDVRSSHSEWRANARAVKVVWQRELVRLTRTKTRIATSLVQPALFLFILGNGLSSLASTIGQDIDFRAFMFPGAAAMTVMFAAVFSASMVVWDREFGFLREMLVAPVSRAALVLGKCLGGATAATLQGFLVLALAGLVGVPYSPRLMLTLMIELALLAFTLTAFGVMIAARIQEFPTFMAITQMLVLPLFFLSGALYPLGNLPTWLNVLTRINPLTYAIDPLRNATFNYLSVEAAVAQNLNPGVTWGSWRVPTLVELAIVLAMGLAMMGVAILQFRRAE